MARHPSGKPLPQPHKRPSQARAVFTVQTLYDGFVRIWRRDGPDAATTRAIAEESGYAVGTLYEYFPNRTALLSGYVRHCMDRLCQDLGNVNGELEGAGWEKRLRRLVGLTLDEQGQAPYFDRQMLLMEGKIASATHHRRAFQQLTRAWRECIATWSDYPEPVDDAAIDTLILMLWGARRYDLLLEGGGGDKGTRIEQSTRMARALLTPEG